ncbi:aldose epimerase family protein [Bosea sp. PAMC 26642]|uniref:aldose epimerase family protein n=1 Tax=Bosea sp. (strain PAMC 26642) TaxID=1792307 RepID=UPI00076FE53B|nr:aldose epimerase family protein [Bosea sp. PAMC 26642]AMJ63393.1 galactose mutarotase [Bosea sp. PAMC 26642]
MNSKSLLGTLADGTPIHEVTLRSPSGAEAKVMEWGAVLRDLVVPRPDGGSQRVVLGFDNLADYPTHSPHMGAIAGRYANRIAHGRFMLDGKDYQAPLNQDGRHSLHGGEAGFSKLPWTIVHHDAACVTLALVSPDGDAGYPGTLQVWCRYSLVGDATLRIELSATTDAATIVNLAHHSYFRLDDAPDILDHELELRANLTTPVDADLIPDGALDHVAGTPFDFRKPRPIRRHAADGARIWYDHNFMLRRDRREPSVAAGLELAHAATLRSARSGLSMQLWTTEPALQVYDGAKLKIPVPGLDGERYGACAGIALEPQHVPDSPNLPHMPSTVLRPGEVYRQVSEYRFGG